MNDQIADPPTPVVPIKTVHFGIRPQMAPYWEGYFRPRFVRVDGDGWESWGEKPGTDANDAETLHVTITGPDSDSVIESLLKSPFKSSLVPMEASYQEGIVVVVTDLKDWSVVERTIWKEDIS